MDKTKSNWLCKTHHQIFCTMFYVSTMFQCQDMAGAFCCAFAIGLLTGSNQNICICGLFNVNRTLCPKRMQCKQFHIKPNSVTAAWLNAITPKCDESYLWVIIMPPQSSNYESESQNLAKSVKYFFSLTLVNCIIVTWTNIKYTSKTFINLIFNLNIY